MDYQAAFLNAELDKKAKIYVEYPKEMVELGYMSQKEADTHVARLATLMYSTVDASLQWNITVTKHKSRWNKD